MKYTGSCHCEKVSFEVDFEMEKVISCNCSYCHKRGLLLSFVKASEFTLLTGADDLTSYRFNKKVIDHLFCKHCGVQSFGKGKNKEGEETLAINLRCLDDVDIEKLTITKVDGKNW